MALLIIIYKFPHMKNNNPSNNSYLIITIYPKIITKINFILDVNYLNCIIIYNQKAYLLNLKFKIILLLLQK